MCVCARASMCVLHRSESDGTGLRGDEILVVVKKAILSL